MNGQVDSSTEENRSLSSEIITLSTHAKVNNMSSVELSDVEDNKAIGVHCQTSWKANELPFQSAIKSTLESNLDMLADKGILNELFPVKDNSQTMEKNSSGASAERIGIENIPPLSYLGMNSTPKAVRNILPVLSKQGLVSKKQVQFCYPWEDGAPNTERDKQSLKPENSSIIGNVKQILGFIPQRCGEDDASQFLIFKEALLSQLNQHKQSAKDLEEELSISEAEYNKVVKQLEIVQKRCMRREEQLKETNKSLENLQSGWKTFQQKMTNRLENSTLHIDQLSEENDKLKRDKEVLLKNVAHLTHQSEDNSILKKELESMTSLAAANKELYENVLTENKRINDALTEKQLNLKNLQGGELVSLQERSKTLSIALENVHVQLAEATASKHVVEEELSLFSQRHSVLLQNLVRETEEKERILKDKDKVMEELENLKNEIPKIEKHLFGAYQSEAQEVLMKRSQELQQHLMKTEGKIMDRMTENIEKQKTSHDEAVEVLHKKHVAELKACKEYYMRTINELVKKSKSLQEQNGALKFQRNNIVAAVSSVLPSSNFASPTEFDVDVPDTWDVPLGIIGVKPPSAPNLEEDTRTELNPTRKKQRELQFVTSTSLSSIARSSSSSDEGRPGFRRHKKMALLKRPVNPTPGKAKSDVYKVEDILASLDSASTSSKEAGRQRIEARKQTNHPLTSYRAP